MQLGQFLIAAALAGAAAANKLSHEWDDWKTPNKDWCEDITGLDASNCDAFSEDDRKEARKCFYENFSAIYDNDAEAAQAGGWLKTCDNAWVDCAETAIIAGLMEVSTVTYECYEPQWLID